jgi:hypothetical protein
MMGRGEGRYSNACVDPAPSPIEIIHFATVKIGSCWTYFLGLH